MLFGKELWSETRIALFQQSIDTRDKETGIRERQARVYFGKDWIKNSVLDIYRDDISRFPLLLTTEVADSMQQLQNGEVPGLKALAMHNGTIWKWNRPCYGVGGGKPHLRIENRYVPSGPSIDDEMANTALWIGAMLGMSDEYKEIWKSMEFEEARENFHKAAKSGLEIGISWKSEVKTARQFALDFLIPIARKGLHKVGVSQKDIEHYMGIIERRVDAGKSGSRWMIRNYRKLKKELDKEDSLNVLTSAIYTRFNSNKALSDWSDVLASESEQMMKSYDRIDKIMTTEIFTVQEDDLMELVLHIMRWRNIRHVPVEDASGVLIGLVTNKVLSDFQEEEDSSMNTVAEFMHKDLITVESSMDINEAMELMLREKIGCLPVVKNRKLIGIVTEKDMTRIWEKLNK